MKKAKAIFSAIAVSVIVFSRGTHSYGLDYCDSLTYVISGDKAIITGYTGNDEVINLPSKIEGYPVTEIRENAFYKCGSLKKIIVPKSVCQIGRYAFFKCTNLETAEINGGALQIPEGLFFGCESLENLSLKISPSVIGDYAFYGCRSLKEFNVPLSVSEIGESSFAECSDLSKITFGRNLKNIKAYAYYNCTSLEKINLPENLLSIGDHAIGFSESGILENITITGISDSIAEHYAKDSGIKFQNRVRYKSQSTVNISDISNFITWLSFALIYALGMIIIISNLKRAKRDPGIG
ncbi:MAG: leucine-rich repeat domain-containing protein [Clostridium sp.]|nr:leucine-rich repeat domain-containing protein [Clostridium sp.]MCM1547985.1 leucine-rich repeat domain-containing protein [Ruminococcus sp.]